MHHMVGTAVCYGFGLGVYGIVYIIKKHRDKKIEKWKSQRAAEKEREMIEVGYRVRNDMMREIALNSNIQVSGKRQKVISKGFFAAAQADVWAIDKNEVQVIL